MPRARTLTHSMNVGEVSNAALARVDQEKLRLAAQTQENIFGKVIGSGQFRPGTTAITSTPSNVRGRLIRFVRSVTDTALLELTSGKLRVMVNDTFVTRPSVSSSVTNGTFAGSGSWTLTTTADGVATIASNELTMYCPTRGGTSIAKQTVTTSNANTVHAMGINVSRGSIYFRIGSSDGADDLLAETLLDEGYHSLAFTPTASSYYIQFFTRSDIPIVITRCQVESAGVMELSAPWSEADLRLIRSDQSLDVVFLACGSWQPRKIERRGTGSWSIAKYIAKDGPFTRQRTSDVTLTVGALNGFTTLTSDRPFFKTSHVGALFRLFHEGQAVTNAVGAANEYTDAIKVTGNDVSDRTFSYAITGTWTGTLVGQRSVEGPNLGFVQWTSITTNTTGSDAEAFNQPVWYRWGFGSVYTSGTANVAQSHGGSGGYGIGRVVSYTSSTSVYIEILDPFVGVAPTKVWFEGEWSDKRGWPTSVAFHDGRLGWARADKIWLSESDAYYTFGQDDEETLTDASSISRSIATSGAVNATNWMMSLQRLVIGTQGAETVARANSFDEPITPTNTQLKDASTQGSAAISPARIDKRGIYIQRSGTKLYELFYNFEQQDYDSANLLEFNNTIGSGGFVELAVQRQPETWLWAIRADGQCVVLLYDAREKAQGLQRFITDGEVESLEVLPGTTEDAVYMIVKRTINGSTVRYIEKMAQWAEAVGGATNKMADSGLLTAGPASSVTVLHLANETGLVGWATDSNGVSGPLTGLSANGSGVVSLGATYTNIWVGLPYRGRYKSAKLAFGTQGGTALLQHKRVDNIGMLLENTHPDAITYGPAFDVLEQMPRIESATSVGSAVHSTYDEIAFPFNGEWDTDSRVCIEINAPYPATILGIVTTLETNET